MGLEAFPDPMRGPEKLNSIALGETFDSSRSSRTSNGTSSSSHPKDIISQQVNSANSPKYLNLTSRFPMEPAPWKKTEGNQSAEAPQSNIPSVYGEILTKLA